MSIQPLSSQPFSSTTVSEPGHLLEELEQRQDDVLAQLDELDSKLIEVLKGLGATMEGDQEEGEGSGGEGSGGEKRPMAA